MAIFFTDPLHLHQRQSRVSIVLQPKRVYYRIERLVSITQLLDILQPISNSTLSVAFFDSALKHVGRIINTYNIQPNRVEKNVTARANPCL